MKNVKLAAKISVISIIMLVIGLLGLWFVTNNQMTKVMEESILQQLSSSVEMQAEIVKNYVAEAETYLTGFAQAPEVAKGLRDSGNSVAVEELQKYTDAYAGIGDLENVYVADYGSTVIASHVQGAIGATLREGDSLKQLQDAIAGGIYNAGILTSQSTGKQVISINYPVDDENGQHLGYVGAAIYAEGLRDTLNELSGEAEGSSYMLLDAAKETYIFCQQDELIGAQIEDENVLQMLASANNTGGQVEFLEYTDRESGEEVISAVYYLAERDWVFVVLKERSIAFSSVRTLTGMLAVICVIVLVLISAAVWCCVSMLARDINKEADIIQGLGTLDFTKKQELDRYCGRKDEVGLIAEATKTMIDSVFQAVSEVKARSTELQKTATLMSENASSTTDNIMNVENAIREIATGAEGQATETEKASESVLHIGNGIVETKEKSAKLSDVAEKISDSSKEALTNLKTLVEINEQVKDAVEQINAQTLTTNESVLKIRDAAQLITSIAESTNLLSLNASIEAARAGEQGKGFAVVAGQIKTLAEQSNDSAKYIDQIIDTLLQDSSNAVQLMNDVKNIMDTQSERLIVTENRFEEVGQEVAATQTAVKDIDKAISNVDLERESVVDVVQSLTAIAEENVASTQESLASMETVSGMVKDVAEIAGQLTDLADAIESNIEIFTL